MALFTRYKDEAEFREQFVKPLLNKLGFFGVTHSHGSQEFGKDFVFSELHRLGGIRHYAAQVKHSENIKQGTAVDGLLTQVRQAFATPFRRADSPRDCHVSAVYIFNSGGISDGAKAQLLDQLGRTDFGDNVHFHDGDRLEGLDRFSTFQIDHEFRARLAGLRNQMSLNLLILNSFAATEMEGRREARGILWHGIEQFMTSPVDSTAIPLEDVYQFWQLGRIAESCLSSLSQVGPPAVKDENLSTLKQITPKLIAHGESIIRAIDISLLLLTAVR